MRSKGTKSGLGIFPIPYEIRGEDVYFSNEELQKFLGWPLPKYKSYLRGVTIPGYLSASGKVYGKVVRFRRFFEAIHKHSGAKEENFREFVQREVWPDKVSK